MSYHAGDQDEAEGLGSLSRSRRMEAASRAFSASAVHLPCAGPGGKTQQSAGPRGFPSDDNLHDPAQEAEPGSAGPREPRLSSIGSNRSTLNSISPLTLKGSSGHLPGRTESMSSEDMIPTKDVATLPRDHHLCRSVNKPESSLSRNSLASYNNPEKRPPSRAHVRPRSGSPGSEMVTLEEFLNEGNQLSPPSRRHSLNDNELITLHQFLLEAETLHPSSQPPSPNLNPKESPQTAPRKHSPSPGSCVWRSSSDRASRRATSLYIPRDASGCKDDMLGDYFKKAGEAPDFGSPLLQSGYRDPQPASRMTTSVSLTLDSSDGSGVKPGAQAKPNLRQLGAQTSPLSLHHRGLAHQSVTLSKQTPEPQRPASPSSRGSPLSRSFSVATADLLKANGPDPGRLEKPEVETPVGKDFSSHVLRSSTPLGSQTSLRERPASARVDGALRGDESRCRPLDTRRLSLAVPKEDQRMHSVPSSAGLQQHHAPVHGSTRTKTRPIPRSGEVVTPVRPVSTIPEVEVSQGLVSGESAKTASGEGHSTLNVEEEPNKRSSSKSTPASPDPSTDPQSVWYEYGCV